MDDAKASRTAEYMALFRALETARGGLCDDPFAARFLGPRLRAAALAARVPVAGALVPLLIDRRWPGPRPSGVVRTRLIDELVRKALGDGCEQLVLLGAGYDTRGLRIATGPVWEVDHPATQARKRAGVGADAPGRIRFVAVDFERDDLGESLCAAGFAEGGPTCVVWEGVFSYLTVAAIDATLGWVTSACGPGSRLVLTYVDQAALDAPAPAWIEAVGAVGEPFITGLKPEEADAFFAARGFALRSDVSTRDAASAHMDAREVARIPPIYRVAELTR